MRSDVGKQESARASRAWWDAEAQAYAAEHGSFLGDGRPDGALVWGPEGWTEDELGLLGPLEGRRVLEVGAGGAQGTRWLASRGAHAVALDLSHAMLAHSRGLSPRVPLVQADAGRLPFRAASFDLACSAYGAVPFVADAGAVFAEVARVLRPGGPFACTYSNRCFPSKAIRGWLYSTDEQHGEIVAEYFRRAGAYDEPTIERRTPVGHRGDPLYGVWSRRRLGPS